MLVNAESKTALALADGSANAGVVAERPWYGRRAFDLSGLGDKHFAIAEDLVEQDRKVHTGHVSWMQHGHQQFCEEHGSVIEMDDGAADDASEVEEEVTCESQFAPCVCAQQIQRVHAEYTTLRDQCVALLRSLRAIRRGNGYVPAHGLLIVLEGACVKEMYFLARLSFSPFDFSAVQFQPRSSSLNGAIEADLVVVAGTAVMHQMAQLLYKLVVVMWQSSSAQLSTRRPR